MKLKEDKWTKISVNHNVDVPSLVYTKVIQFFVDNDLYSGESVMQSDAGSIEGIQFLADLADFLEFEVEDK